MDSVRLRAARARRNAAAGRVMAARTFVLGREDKGEAWAEVQKLAAVLVRHRITDRYGVSVHEVPGKRGAYLTDRTPELGPPALLAISAFRSFGLAA
ncbi:hypothetical protein ACFCV8_17265 [Streptomyces sp. NPDC056347]|uniref:hypothetical protein n=1 Tax=Streptomyces sp. NPDC056347 TaxID=3345790 RepID=UPI0035D6278C